MKIISFSRHLIALLSVVSILAIPASNASASYPDNSAATVMQFTSGGHVLGFDNNGVYLAGTNHTLRVEFAGGNAVQPISESAGSTIEDIKELTRVTYSNAWDNIDVIYSAVSDGIAESTYVLHPGANPSDIRLRYNAPVEITADGELSFSFGNGSLTESAPIAWQETGGQRTPINVSFVQQDKAQAGFALGNYDKNYTVYIDPTFRWHTFYGGSGTDSAASITRDSSGNTYTTGYSDGSWNGPEGQPPLNAHTAGSNYDIVVIKLSRTGDYQWHTFYGSTGTDEGLDIALDPNGDVCLAGYSSGSWNGPAGQAPLHAFTNVRDITVLRLNSAGAYVWHTFFGTSWADTGYGITTDTSGNSYVAAHSDGTWNGPDGQRPVYEEDGTFGHNITVIKLGRAGSYLWHTFHGTDNSGDARDIALDPGGNIYVTGNTFNSWDVFNGSVWKGPLNAFAGDYNNNIFVLKLNNSGIYQWHTFYGSAGSNDYGSRVAIDTGGNAYIAGYSMNSWNGSSGQGPLHPYNADSDICILKLDGNGTYQWHAFYGSTSSDFGMDIMPGPGGDLYVSGASGGTWNGPNGQAPLHAFGSSTRSITIIKLDTAGAYGWHDFYGAAGYNSGMGLCVSPAGYIQVAGYEQDNWNGPDGQAPLHAFTGYTDIVIMKLGGYVSPTITRVTPATGEQRDALTITITGNYFDEVTTVDFGPGITVSSYTVDSATQITARIVISPTSKLGSRNVVVTTTIGPGYKTDAFKVLGQESTTSPIGSGSMTTPTQAANVNNPQSIPTAALPNIVVQGASLSTTTVSPNTPVIVTADISNKGTANGSKKVTVYVNGEIETTQGVNIDSNNTSKLTFNISRSEPGEYSVYVDGTPAGSFKVEAVTASDTILIVSIAFLAIAFVCGLIMLRRRQGAGR